MAVRPGEENVATLFGDVHYFYSPPTDNPPHHRFDKGSYVYLFENAYEGRARIEVANRPGSEDQDAFDGFLDRVHVTYSYRHHCMVSLVVGDVDGPEEWHLPTYDPRNENKYHYKLHSLDIYFWTQQDALSFVNGVRRVLPPNQVDVQDEPAPPPRHEQRQHSQVNPLVQRLENVALSESTIPPPPPQTNGSNGNIPSFAPPPVSAVSGGDDNDDANSATSPASFAPMAYNPAAPAAPEQIRHREKTPPPEDVDLHPLHARLVQDASTPFSPGLVSGLPSGLSPLSPGVPPPQFHPMPGAPNFPAPPVQTPGLPPPQGFGAPSHPGMTRAVTMPVHGSAPSPALQSPYGFGQFPASPGFASPPTPHQALTAPVIGGVPGVTHSTHTPTPPPPALASPGLPPPPPGGYSNYTYATQQGGGHGLNEYQIHQQAYRPTEGEVAVKYQPKKEVRGRLEENAGRIERSVTGMLKKFEKKFG
ncbi:hypothetical protein VP1G_05936 [Cytospora mali]|uniref:RNA recognition motif-containing protein n=1 Tax=Cytospora mali TaxID=578113 RepID=A0A194V467_CYTMA|nr:hypothetical protein VP1G_05936 [Valsa mali var. pyri (nom. inval.)]